MGAKRFSFLAREFARMGFDVHVITNDIGESPHGRDDHSLPRRRHACIAVAAPFEVPLTGATASCADIANALLRRMLAPVGLEYFWARAATRKALEVAAKLPRGIVIATSPPHAALIAGARVARQTALAADPRLSRSVERLRLAANGTAAGFTQWFGAPHRGAPGAAQRGARAQHPEHARLVRGIFSAARRGAELRDAEWLRRGAGARTRRRRRADRNRARRRDLRQPLAACRCCAPSSA